MRLARATRTTQAIVRGVAFCVGVGATLVAWPQASSRQTPTFSAGVELIRLSVSVTDARSRHVPDLAQNSFAVFEDGVRQELSFFTRDPLPLSVALLIDCSASMDQSLPVAQAAGVRFIATLGPEDAGQVVQFSDRMLVLQDFTSSHAALEAAIRMTEASGPTALHNALYVTLKQMRREVSSERPRRRAIVLLSDGEDTASVVDEEQVLEQARQSDVGIYVIALRPAKPNERQRMEFNRATYFLNALARETGGRVYFPTALSELETVYRGVAEELRAQYTLGYVSANTRRDGKWRRIVVRTPSRSDVQLRHKLGYQAPRG